MHTNTSKSILLQEYMETIEATDELPKDDLHPVQMGLFGEIGSIMAVAKKLRREQDAYPGFQQSVEEEFGDALWYFGALCKRLDVNIDSVFVKVTDTDEYKKRLAASDRVDGPVSHIASLRSLPPLEEALPNLGQATAALFKIQKINSESHNLIGAFADQYLKALQAAQLVFSDVVYSNMQKSRGRFQNPNLEDLPTFDGKFDEEEKLPQKFRIKITQRKSGQSYLQWNGVFIGDPLTDNIRDPDGYRFHDVFHLAHAAILHWSPTFRALIKQKRKSDRMYDEAQDGGRAIVVEEGLTAWIFSRAKGLNFFDSQSRISFDMLKTVHQFVRGYEVEECPLSLWERAILDGYTVFRKIRENGGGIVIGDRGTRTIKYGEIKDD